MLNEHWNAFATLRSFGKFHCNFSPLKMFGFFFNIDITKTKISMVSLPVTFTDFYWEMDLSSSLSSSQSKTSKKFENADPEPHRNQE